MKMKDRNRRKDLRTRFRIETLETRNLLSGTGTDGAPSLVLQGIQAGQTVSKTLTISAQATGLTTAANIEYLLNGQDLAVPSTSGPTAITWDSTTTWDGRYTLQAVAHDATGAVLATSPAVPVTVLNGPAGETRTNVVTPDVTKPVSGSFQPQIALTFGPERGTYVSLYIDGIHVTKDFNSQDFSTADNPYFLGKTRTYTINATVDTTLLTNGWHMLATKTVVDRGQSPWPVSDYQEIPFYVDNTHSLATVSSAWRQMFVVPGTTSNVAPQEVFSDGTTAPLPAGTPISYTVDNPAIATVAADGTVTGVAQGIANVTISALGKRSTVQVVVDTAHAVVHFGKDGKILTQYDPNDSIFVTSMFNLTPGEVANTPGLGQAAQAAGINTLTGGLYQNPNDGPPISQADWTKGSAWTWNNQVTVANTYGMSLLLTGDDVARNYQELNNSIGLSNPWGPQAVQTALQRARDSHIVIGVDMIDEANMIWGNTPTPTDGRWAKFGTPDDAFTKLMQTINNVPGGPNISWPVMGASSASDFAAWENARMANYQSIYWSNVQGAGSPQGYTLAEQQRGILAKLSSVQTIQGLNEPNLLLTFPGGPFYDKNGPGSNYTAGQDTLWDPGENPVSTAMQIMDAAASGMAGVREYSYDWQHWKDTRASSPAGTQNLQTGVDPFTVGTDRWQAMATANNLVKQITPFLLQAQISSPNLGTDILTTARQGASGRLVMAVNGSTAARTVTLPFSAYGYAGGTIERYRQLGASLESDSVPAGQGDTVTLAPGETIVWLFRPAAASGADVTPASIVMAGPIAGSTVSGSVIVRANAADNVGVDHVTFFVDGKAVATETSGPYCFVWDSSTARAGSWHALSAIAYDAAGNASEAREMVLVAATAGVQPSLVPTVTAVAATAQNGTTLTTNLASITTSRADRMASDFSATIAWGDGQTSTGVVTADSKGGFAVQGTHVFAQSGANAAQVTVKDMITNRSYQASSTITVVGGLTVGGDLTLTSNAHLTRSGSFTPPAQGTSDTATVDYGDGSGAAPLTLDSVHGTFALDHTYNGNGNYTVTVSLKTPANGVLQASFHANVNVAAPAVLLGVSAPAGPLNTPLAAADVTFDRAIDPSTLAAALTLTRDGSTVAFAAAPTVSLVAGTTATYHVAGLAASTGGDGSYTLTVRGSAVRDLQGVAAGGTKAATFLVDRTAPTSRVTALPAVEPTLSFTVTVTGSDPAAAAGRATSGLSTFEVFVAVDGGPFEHLATVAAGAPNASGIATATVAATGVSGHSYAFRSLARDGAGNVESKPAGADTTTVIADLIPPATRVASVDSSSQNFSVQLSGTDAGGSGLSAFDLYAQVDGGSPSLVAHVAAGAANAAGVYSASAGYAAIVDGASHTYRFYTVGTDGRGNVEQVRAPGSNDVTVVKTFSPTLPTPNVTGFSVNHGSANRSFVRTVDINFDQTGAVLNNLIQNGRIHLVQHQVDGVSRPTDPVIDLTGKARAIDHAIEIDFGPNGIGPAGANGTTTLGDGTYDLTLALGANASAVTSKQTFYRLLGDVSGDGVVDSKDFLQVSKAMNRPGSSADVDGNGVVNNQDYVIARRMLGHSIKSGTVQTASTAHLPQKASHAVARPHPTRTRARGK